MNIVRGLDKPVNIRIAGFARIHTGKYTRIPVDHLCCIVERRAVAPVSIDDHQFAYAVPDNAHTDFVDKAGEGFVADTDGALEVLMVIGDPVGNGGQHKRFRIAAGLCNTRSQSLGVESIRIQGKMGTVLLDRTDRQ